MADQRPNSGPDAGGRRPSSFQPDKVQSFTPAREPSEHLDSDPEGLSSGAAAPTTDLPGSSATPHVGGSGGGPGGGSGGRGGSGGVAGSGGSSSGGGGRGVSPEQSGDEIGPWTLIDPIGKGGFGQVWRVRREKPFRQFAALKLLRMGRDSDQLRARFRLEREVLGRLNHPYIAGILDGGESPLSGMPYLVTQFVAGKPLGAFCDDRKLDVRERLELFLKVCEAVSHAHEKSVVHRDLKPDNILAFDAGDGMRSVTVIDFGVAKMLDGSMSDTVAITEIGQMIGSPEYMSPEQVDPDISGIDARSDIYALGVVLYELLVGALPHDLSAARRKARVDQEGAKREIRHTIREIDPPTPSKRLSTIVSSDAASAQKIASARRLNPELLESQLRGELEWIPMMAMRKEPQNRYRTVAHLADDVRNYLESRPLLAGPPSLAYKTRKFVRRNRLPVAMAASGVLAVGVLVTGAMAALNSQRAAAVEERNEAIEDQRAMLRSLALSLLASATTEAKSDEDRQARADLLALATERLRKFCETPDEDLSDDRSRSERAADLLLYARTAFAAADAAYTERPGRASADRLDDRQRFLAEARQAATRATALGANPVQVAAVLLPVEIAEADALRAKKQHDKARPSYVRIRDETAALLQTEGLAESDQEVLEDARLTAVRAIADYVRTDWLERLQKLPSGAGDAIDPDARRLWMEQRAMLAEMVEGRRKLHAAACARLAAAPTSSEASLAVERSRLRLAVAIERLAFTAISGVWRRALASPEECRALEPESRELAAEYNRLFESVPAGQLSGNQRMEWARARTTIKDWEIDAALAMKTAKDAQAESTEGKVADLGPEVAALDREVTGSVDEYLALCREDGGAREYIQKLGRLQEQHLGGRRFLGGQEAAGLPPERRLELLTRIRKLRLDAERTAFVARVPSAEMRVEIHALIVGNLARSAMAMSEIRARATDGAGPSSDAIAAMANDALAAMLESAADLALVAQNSAGKESISRTAALNLFVQWEHGVAVVRRLSRAKDGSVTPQSIAARLGEVEQRMAQLRQLGELARWDSESRAAPGDALNPVRNEAKHLSQ